MDRWESLLVATAPTEGYVCLLPDTGLSRAEGRVAVLTSGGAGGLLALARRSLPGLEVVRAHSTLRDLDDLAGNAARVVAAAGELGELEVAVELPYASGWEDAAEAIEAAGLTAAVARHDRWVEQLAGLVELDLPFHLLPGFDPVTALDVVAVLVETGEVAQARAALDGRGDVPAVDLDRLRRRLRRRLRSVAVADPVAAADRLSRSRWG